MVKVILVKPYLADPMDADEIWYGRIQGHEEKIEYHSQADLQRKLDDLRYRFRQSFVTGKGGDRFPHSAHESQIQLAQGRARIVKKEVQIGVRAQIVRNKRGTTFTIFRDVRTGRFARRSG